MHMMASRTFFAFAIILSAVVVIAVGSYSYSRQRLVQTIVNFTIDGTVERIIADCPPSPNPGYTCTFFDLMVLRAVNEHTYMLRNLPEPVQIWIGKQVSVTGNLVSPSSTGLAFIEADFYVTSIVSLTT